MTPQEQIHVIAEVDGKPAGNVVMNHYSPTGLSITDSEGVICGVHNYIESYDAILPVIQKQNPEIRYAMTKSLGCATNDWILNIHATPAQLCEALIKALGKWKD